MERCILKNTQGFMIFCEFVDENCTVFYKVIPPTGYLENYVRNNPNKHREDKS